MPVPPAHLVVNVDRTARRQRIEDLPPRRNGRWVVLLILMLGLCGFALLSFWLRQRLHGGGVGSPSTAPVVTDHSKMPPPPGRQLEMPDRERK